MGSRVELFARIRRDARVEGLGIRALARKHKVGRDTVRTALAQAEPPPRKTPVRESPRLGPFADAIEQMLRDDLDAPRKQRHTAKRIFERLRDDCGFDAGWTPRRGKCERRWRRGRSRARREGDSEDRSTGMARL